MTTRDRWLVIALDGLEYTLVEKFNLKNLQQVVYGKIDVSEFPLLVTPIVWSSFITGQSAEKVSRNYLPKWQNRFLEWLRLKSIKVGLNRIKGKGKIFTFLGYKKRQTVSYEDIIRRFRESSVKTFFDMIPSSVALSVPPLQTWVSDETRFLMEKVVETGNFTLFEENVWTCFIEKRKKFMKIVRDGGWNLFMCHFMFTDLLGHFYIDNHKKMRTIYSEADTLVKQAKEDLCEDTKVLVISDHGMMIPPDGTLFGDHSNYGFYSCNKELSLKNPRLSSFWDEIVC